jgi:adenylate cyclase
VSEAAALTNRQREILELAAKGLTNADIAGLLEISPSTVKVHMAAIYRVLNVSNRTEAAMVAQSHINPPDPATGTAIAVLPFEVFSSDPEETYFADGLVEEIITRLSRWQWFPVIARQSSFAYRNQAVDIRQVGQELGAAYVVEGSVRHSSETVRVTAQLIDTRDNTHMWAETFDGPRGEIFTIQDELAKSITAEIHPEVVRSQMQLAQTFQPTSVDAWQLAMGGLAHILRRSKAEVKRGLSLAARSLQEDANNLIGAYAMTLGNYYQLAYQWTSDPFDNATGVAEHAAKCIALAPDDPYSLIADGTAHMLRGDVQGAIDQLRRATERNPSSARAFSFLGQLVGMQGDPDSGIELLQQAITLSPRDAALNVMLASIGVCHFGAGRLDQACHFLHRAVDQDEGNTIAWSILSAAAALAGSQEEAEAALAELNRVQPDFTLEGFHRISASILPAYLAKFEEGIRLAGYRD